LLVVSPRRVLSEILSKGWVESTVPFLADLHPRVARPAGAISTSARTDDLWDWIGSERFLTIPISFWVFFLVAAGVLVMFRQSRFGWHVLAAGGNRKAARHGGIRVKATIFLAYALAGLIVGLSGLLYATRENAVASDTGVGMEFFALTALVVGLGGFVPGGAQPSQ
jgi:ribose transport system permease protein